MNNEYLKATEMINYEARGIQNVIKQRKWEDASDYEKIKAIYYYVQNDIKFGYNRNDNLRASEVLDDGYGQCNTKATLLMALLRGVGIPCRIHGFEVTKDFQRGITSGIVSILAPKLIIHTWVEVLYNKQWLALEGVILDLIYVEAIKAKFPDVYESFRQYAIATNDFQNLSIDWNENSTYIQSAAIVHNFDVFSSPDEFFEQYSQELGSIKKWLYAHMGRRMMNRNVKKIRNR